MSIYSVKSVNTKVSINELPPEAWQLIVGDERSGGKTDLQAHVAYLQRGATLVASTLAGMPFQIDDGNKDNAMWAHDEPLPDELAWLERLPVLMLVTTLSLIFTGKAYWHVEKNTVRPLNVRWLLPSSIDVKRDKKGKITGYGRKVNGSTIPLKIDEVVRFWLPDHNVENAPPKIYPAKAALSGATVLRNLDAFLEQYFERGMVRATLLTSSGIIQKTDRDRLKAWWNRVAMGIKNAFATEVVQADAVTPVIIGEGVKELGNGALVQEKREDVLTALGIPHSMVMSNAANYATANQDTINFYSNTIIPLAQNVIKPAIDEMLKRYADGLQLRWMHEKLEPFQKAELEKAEAVQRVVGGAVLTVNEGRGLLGYEPVKGGDEINKPQPLNPMQPRPELPEPDVSISEGKSVGWSVDSSQFRRWYTKRIGEDVAGFDSVHLSHYDKLVIADDVMRLSVENYP